MLTDEVIARITALEERIESVSRRVPGGQERIRHIERQVFDHEKRITELEASAPLLDPGVLARGMTKGRKDLVKEIMDTIALISEKGDGRAYIPDLVAVLMPALCIEDIAEVIKKLKREGEIFEPRPGYLKLP